MAKRTARILGALWMVLVAAAGLVFMARTTAAMGALSSGRGTIVLVFLAALPGLLLWRWGRR